MSDHRRPNRVISGRAQYFETLGHRAIWKDGWKAVAYHRRGSSYDEDKWELYHLDDRGFAERATVNIRPDSPRNRSRFTYHWGMHHIGTGAAPVVADHPFQINAEIDRLGETADGVLLAHGSVNSGYCLMVDDGHLGAGHRPDGVRRRATVAVAASLHGRGSCPPQVARS